MSVHLCYLRVSASLQNLALLQYQTLLHKFYIIVKGSRHIHQCQCVGGMIYIQQYALLNSYNVHVFIPSILSNVYTECSVYIAQYTCSVAYNMCVIRHVLMFLGIKIFGFQNVRRNSKCIVLLFFACGYAYMYIQVSKK